MGRQTSQYSPCISVCDPVYFYMVSATFYAVNF